MNPTVFCIGFIQIAGASITLPPPNIQTLIQERLQHQWRQRLEGSPPELRFDDTSCTEQGSYHYTDRSLILNADTESWRGPLEIALTSLVDGERLPFERVTRTEFKVSPSAISLGAGDSRSTWKSWLPWTLVTVGAVVGLWAWREREAHVKELRGLAIKF